MENKYTLKHIKSGHLCGGGRKFGTKKRGPFHLNLSSEEEERTCWLISGTVISISHRHSPGDMESERGGSALSLQTQGHLSAESTPPALYRMSEGDVTVLPFGPASLDLSRQEQHTLTRLYSKNGGYHLRILPDGTVSGGRQENDSYDILRIKAVSAGVVVIKGEATGRYLAMNKNGRLYGSQALNDECYFLETYEENHYNTYRSQKYSWYVALKRNGQPKAGPDTHQGQKAIFFLPRSAGNM